MDHLAADEMVSRALADAVIVSDAATGRPSTAETMGEVAAAVPARSGVCGSSSLSPAA